MAASGETTLQYCGDISGEVPLMLGKGKYPETV